MNALVYQDALDVYKQAGITDPRRDLDVAEVYVPFSWYEPMWLENLGQSTGAELRFVPYNHLSQTLSSFSWLSVLRLFQDFLFRRRMNVPLACIEGMTELQFSKDLKVEKVSEELSYAVDIRRGVLRNRRCSQDLRLFLETGRRMNKGSPDEWYNRVATSLPWQSVPGSGAMDVDPVEEGSSAAVFMGFSLLVVLLFSSLLAPALLGPIEIMVTP